MKLGLKQFPILFSCHKLFFIFLFVSFSNFISFSSQYNISVTHFFLFLLQPYVAFVEREKKLEGFMCLRFYGTCSIRIFFSTQQTLSSSIRKHFPLLAKEHKFTYKLTRLMLYTVNYIYFLYWFTLQSYLFSTECVTDLD